MACYRKIDGNVTAASDFASCGMADDNGNGVLSCCQKGTFALSAHLKLTACNALAKEMNVWRMVYVISRTRETERQISMVCASML